MKLTESRVSFDAVSHTYSLDGLPLQGITKRIKEKLFSEEYAGVPEATLKAAAERGHRIHTAFELYDTVDITTTECPELDNYISERGSNPLLATHAASEYLVSDDTLYASCIDKVHQDPEDENGAILADLKTTYKLNEEYVSWQLSVYAMFFEAMNPGLHVTKLLALWFRDGRHKVVEVQRKSESQVRDLLYTENAVSRTDEADATTLPTIAQVEQQVMEYKRMAEEYAQKYDELKAGMLKLMDKMGVKKYEGTHITITRKADSVRETFDTKAFKADHADLYNNYIKKSVTKGSITIKIKEYK